MSPYLDPTPRRTLAALLETHTVYCPDVWDCFSAKVAQHAGAEAIYLHMGAFALATCGLPDAGLVTAEETVDMARRILDCCPLPLIVDARDGLGVIPQAVYRTCYRLAAAGVAGIVLQDVSVTVVTDPLAAEPSSVREQMQPEQEWLEKLDAARRAVEGTDCLLIAKTGALRHADASAALARCRHAVQILGEGHLTAVDGLFAFPQERDLAQHIADEVPGRMLYEGDAADIASTPEPDKYRLIAGNFFLKTALLSMLDVAEHNLANWNTVYSDQLPYAGKGDGSQDKYFGDTMEQMDAIYDLQGWASLEKNGRLAAQAVTGNEREADA